MGNNSFCWVSPNLRTITEYEYDKKTGTSNGKFDMSRVRKYTNILLQGSYDKIVNNQNGIEIPALVF